MINKLLFLISYVVLMLMIIILVFDNQALEEFVHYIDAWKNDKKWTKEEIVALFHKMIPDFGHKETGKYLDGKM